MIPLLQFSRGFNRLQFLDGTGPMTRFWLRKLDALTGFYRYCLARGYVSGVRRKLKICTLRTAKMTNRTIRISCVSVWQRQPCRMRSARNLSVICRVYNV